MRERREKGVERGERDKESGVLPIQFIVSIPQHYTIHFFLYTFVFYNKQLNI
jgi:hypothetical protein